MKQFDTSCLSAVWSTDFDGKCDSWVSTVAALPSMSGCLVSQWLSELVVCRSSRCVVSIETAIAARRPFREEVVVGHTEGGDRTFVISGMPSAAGYSGAVIEITALHSRLAAAEAGAAAYRMMVDNSSDLIAHCGPDGKYTRVSSSYSRVLGWSPEQMIGKKVVEFIHPVDQTGAEAALADVLAGVLRTGVVQIRKRMATGDYLALGTKGRTIYDGTTGECLGAVLVSRDITDETAILRKIEAMAEENTALIDNSPDIIMLLNPAGMILKANRAVMGVLGVEPADLVSIKSVLSIANADSIMAMSQALLVGWQNGHSTVVVGCANASGRTIYLSWCIRRPEGSNVLYATARDVTEQTTTRQALDESYDRLHMLLESIDDGFFSVNSDWEILYANSRAAAFAGVARVGAVGLHLWDAATGLAQSSAAALLRAAMDRREGAAFEVYYEPASIWISARVYAHGDGLSVFFHDISVRVARENQLRESEQRFRETIGITPAGYVLVDEVGVIRDVNPALCQLFGYPSEELLGRPVAIVLDHLVPGCALNVEHPSKNAHAIETVLVRKDGSKLFALVNQTVRPGRGDAGATITAFITDITERKEAEERLEVMATRDELTGLPNRSWIIRRVSAMLSEGDDSTFATVLFIDLNRFKEVNDSLGHAAGDRLLREVGSRLEACMRPGDVVARLGGDEFVVAARCSGRDAASAIAKRLLTALRDPFYADGVEMRIGASIGISLSSQQTASTQTLFENADTAMYKAKAAGDSSYQFFDPGMSAEAKRRLILESGLHRALEQSQFELHYQPRVRLSDMTVVGVEALLRWNHPELGRVNPLEFIPLAEERGHIGAIGFWVLVEACKTVRDLVGTDGIGLCVSVNVSARQLRSAKLVGQVVQALNLSQLPAGRLELEITESALIEDLDQSAAVLKELKKIGVRIAIDDFGTGFSSLSYLRRFPVDVLKLDRSFVNEDNGCGDNVDFVRALIKMTHALDLSVVAEGIETAECRAALAIAECDEGQGYLFSPGLPADALDGFLLRFGAQKPNGAG